MRTMFPTVGFNLPIVPLVAAYTYREVDVANAIAIQRKKREDDIATAAALAAAASDESEHETPNSYASVCPLH